MVQCLTGGIDYSAMISKPLSKPLSKPISLTDFQIHHRAVLTGGIDDYAVSSKPRLFP